MWIIDEIECKAQNLLQFTCSAISFHPNKRQYFNFPTQSGKKWFAINTFVQATMLQFYIHFLWKVMKAAYFIQFVSEFLAMCRYFTLSINTQKKCMRAHIISKHILFVYTICNTGELKDSTVYFVLSLLRPGMYPIIFSCTSRKNVCSPRKKSFFSISLQTFSSFFPFRNKKRSNSRKKSIIFSFSYPISKKTINSLLFSLSRKRPVRCDVQYIL